jgi:hypothetical protein
MTGQGFAASPIMKKIALWLLKIAFALAVTSTLLLYLTRSRPVALSFAPDPDMLRPRNYCVMNPFRDKSPEIVAETYLKKLRDGDLASIRPFLTNESPRQRIEEAEQKWPIQSWRIGARIDKPDETQLMYWVTRGSGYSRDGIEEEARFWVKKSAAGWALSSYNAIY